jgi:hypothetical protein
MDPHWQMPDLSWEAITMGIDGEWPPRPVRDGPGSDDDPPPPEPTTTPARPEPQEGRV